MKDQQTLVLIKPDGIAKEITGNVISELSNTAGSFDNYFVGPIPPQSYTISSDSSIWRISPETGERELIPRVEAASIGFDQLKKTTEIKVSDEAINALQSSIDGSGCAWGCLCKHRNRGRGEDRGSTVPAG